MRLMTLTCPGAVAAMLTEGDADSSLEADTPLIGGAAGVAVSVCICMSNSLNFSVSVWVRQPLYVGGDKRV